MFSFMYVVLEPVNWHGDVLHCRVIHVIWYDQYIFGLAAVTLLVLGTEL